MEQTRLFWIYKDGLKEGECVCMCVCVLVMCSHSCGVALGSDHKDSPTARRGQCDGPKKSLSLSDEEGAEAAGAAGPDGSLLTKGVEREEGGRR